MRQKNFASTATAVVILIALILAFMWLAEDDRTSKAPLTNGDVVGPETGETSQAYRDRVASSLRDASPDTPSFSLVAFAEPCNIATAASDLDGLRRVNALVPIDASPIPVAEPTHGATRADVFALYAKRAGYTEDLLISGAIVFDTGDALRKIAGNPDISSIEVLPSDAAWGRFGVRPPNRASLH